MNLLSKRLMDVLTKKEEPLMKALPINAG